MARELFVDASAWIALADKSDTFHALAAKIYPQLLTDYQRLITTNLVVAEVYIVVRVELGHAAATAFLESVRDSPRIEKIFSTRAMEEQAETILRKYDDQDFSYADAVSFALMKERGIKEAFAFDKHFLTMSIRCIPTRES